MDQDPNKEIIQTEADVSTDPIPEETVLPKSKYDGYINNLLFISIGALIGTGLRLGTDELSNVLGISQLDGSFPSLLSNIIGSFLLGFFSRNKSGWFSNQKEIWFTGMDPFFPLFFVFPLFFSSPSVFLFSLFHILLSCFLLPF